MQFWVDAELYRRTYDPTMRCVLARQICEKYLNKDAVAEINIDWKILQRVNELMAGDMVVQQSLFVEAQQSVEDLIHTNCLLDRKFGTYLQKHKGELLSPQNNALLENFRKIRKIFKEDEKQRKKVIKKMQRDSSIYQLVVELGSHVSYFSVVIPK